MNIKSKLKSILEGTLEETALSHAEADELYRLKTELETEKKSLMFVKDSTEKNKHEVRIQKLEQRIKELRSKAFTQS
jgi:hypothetical protein